MRKLAVGLFIVLIAILVIGSQYEKQRLNVSNLKVLEQELIESLLVEKAPQTGQPAQSGEASRQTDSPEANNKITGESRSQEPTSVQQYQQKIGDRITVADQVKIAAIVSKGLTKNDITYLVELSKDGVTSEEKQSIKGVLRQKLTDQEINQLRNIYKKYQDELKTTTTP